MAGSLDEAWLARLAHLTPEEGVVELAQFEILDGATVAGLAEAALTRAEATPETAAAWLAIADAANAVLGSNPAAEAAILYARARLNMLVGDLAAAETRLAEAAQRWAAAGDAVGAARSNLGLTQVLAMQGRYTEAERTVRSAIAQLDALGAGAVEQALAARQNLATLFSYQERHAEALAELRAVRRGQQALLDARLPGEEGTLRPRAARTEQAIALALTYLDDPHGAEVALLAALALLPAAEDATDRGRVRTNLANLYSRTGRHAQALEQLNLATVELLGMAEVGQARARWPQAGVLFLEQATTYLSLNLLSEAEEALDRAAAVFDAAGQRYELGQVRYYQGLAASGRGDLPAAAAAWEKASALFDDLANVYWLHRVQLSGAAVALQQQDVAGARQQLDALAAEADQPASTGDLRWDLPMLVELHLLRARLALAAGELDVARQATAAALGAGRDEAVDLASLLPHLYLRLLHTLGQVDQRSGDILAARRHYLDAVEAIEAQRALLPLEELRAAYLADKGAIYADLVLSLLASPAPAPGEVAEAFAVVERARARTLLERLLAAVEAPGAEGGNLAPDSAARMADVRRELTWLYNQLLGGEGSRHAAQAISQEIRVRESTLQQLAWHGEGWLASAEPATLSEIQARLADDQQALVYFGAGDEFMAFVVTRETVQVVRNVCQVAALEAAAADLRFQMGRVEVGGDYAARHQTRLAAGARAALARLYNLVIAPLQPWLAAPRLLVIPYGSLHLVPFHALWDGTKYLLETFEVTYAPSASVAVHRRRQPGPLRALAALALSDVAIPQAEAEVRAAARHFADATLLVDAAASFAGLRAGAASADVLHVATHGLFRADNPFFSALKLADGWLDVRQIYRLPLAARMVVLSACESGAVQVQGSDEPIGLVRGFLGAGAETLVVSLWNVHDASAAQLMEHFYGSLMAPSGGRASTALRAAQLAAVDQGRHPYFWAPYVVVGD